MLVASVIILVSAAVVGGALAVRHFRGGPLTIFLTGMHGIFAIFGVTILLLAIVRSETSPVVATAAVLLGLAVVLGAILVYYHMRGRRDPSTLILIHGGVALVALALLCGAVFLAW